jgi:two-component system, LytTR family, response regulator
MNILIIEDELLVARDLKIRVEKLEPDAHIHGPLASVEAAKDWLSKNKEPDLILSDIQLSDGISFDIFENRTISCPIIFTTAYDTYAIRAFKLNSIDYLLKPIDEKELEKALLKFRKFSTGAINEPLSWLLKHLAKEPKKYKERFLSVQRNSLVPVTVDEIAFFHKEELIFIHTTKGGKLISDHTALDEVESLVDAALFFRVNRQYLVHLQAVARMKPTYKGMSVELKPPFPLQLDLSREKVSAFKKWMGE